MGIYIYGVYRSQKRKVQLGSLNTEVYGHRFVCRAGDLEPRFFGSEPRVRSVEALYRSWEGHEGGILTMDGEPFLPKEMSPDGLTQIKSMAYGGLVYQWFGSVVEDFNCFSREKVVGFVPSKKAKVDTGRFIHENSPRIQSRRPDGTFGLMPTFMEYLNEGGALVIVKSGAFKGLTYWLRSGNDDGHPVTILDTQFYKPDLEKHFRLDTSYNEYDGFPFKETNKALLTPEEITNGLRVDVYKSTVKWERK